MYNRSFLGKTSRWTCDFLFPCGILKVKRKKYQVTIAKTYATESIFEEKRKYVSSP